MIVVSPTGAPSRQFIQPTPEFPLGSPLRAIQDKGSVRVAVLDDLLGFAWRDPSTGRRSGLDIGIARMLARSLFGGTISSANEHIEFVDITAAERELICKDDGADFVISSFAITNSRRNKVDFTDPYHGTPLALMGRSGEPEPDISKARIAVVEASNSHEYVKRHDLGAKVVIYQNTSELPASVASGETDVAVIMNAVLENFIKSGRFPVQSLRQSLVLESWGIGVRKGNDQLRGFLNSQLCMMVDDGTVVAAAAADAGSASPAPLLQSTRVQ